jgi:hypothetical protein
VTDRVPRPLAEPGALAGVERASATPTRAVARAHAERAPEVSGETPRSLREVQAWTMAAITGAGAGEAAAARVVTPGARLSSGERLEIYRAGYRARLVECLLDDYPVLAGALGEPRFEALCLAYIERHPSSSPSLNYFGRHMSAFCREAPFGDPTPTPPQGGARNGGEQRAENGGEQRAENGGEQRAERPGILVRAFAADLAALEWALVEVLHAATPAPLDPAELQRIPIEVWGEVRFVPSASVRVLVLEHPVNAFFQARRVEGVEAPIPAPAASAVAVYRSGLGLWRMDLTPAMTRVLRTLLGGATLGEALARIGTDESDPAQVAEAERSVMVWFREWVSSGFFERLLIPG